MSAIYTLWKGNPSYKRVLIREVDRQYNSYKNVQVWVKPNWGSYKGWFWNIQFFILGTTKCNGMLQLRLDKFILEFGW